MVFFFPHSVTITCLFFPTYSLRLVLEINSVKGITWISMIKINMLEVYTTEFDILNSVKEQFSGLALVG